MATFNRVLSVLLAPTLLSKMYDDKEEWKPENVFKIDALLFFVNKCTITFLQ